MTKRKLPSDEKLIFLYNQEKKSMKEICRLYNLSPN